MKDFFIKNKLSIFLISIIIILSISLFVRVLGMENFEEVNYEFGIVNTDYLNMRSGSGITFTAIDLLEKNEYVRIYGKIGEWYIVQNEENKIGTVNSKYITLTDEQKAPVTNTEEITSSTNSDTNDLVESSILTNEENELLTLINKERISNNLQELIIDNELQNTAELKAKDLVENNYFSHNSPTYRNTF